MLPRSRGWPRVRRFERSKRCQQRRLAVARPCRRIQRRVLRFDDFVQRRRCRLRAAVAHRLAAKFRTGPRLLRPGRTVPEFRQRLAWQHHRNVTFRSGLFCTQIVRRISRRG